jgi:hypothetical protein
MAATRQAVRQGIGEDWHYRPPAKESLYHGCRLWMCEDGRETERYPRHTGTRAILNLVSGSRESPAGSLVAVARLGKRQMNIVGEQGERNRGCHVGGLDASYW